MAQWRSLTGCHGQPRFCWGSRWWVYCGVGVRHGPRGQSLHFPHHSDSPGGLAGRRPMGHGHAGHLSHRLVNSRVRYGEGLLASGDMMQERADQLSWIWVSQPFWLSMPSPRDSDMEDRCRITRGAA